MLSVFIRFALFLSILVTPCLVAHAGALTPAQSPPRIAANFRLCDHLGASLELHRLVNRKAVVIVALDGLNETAANAAKALTALRSLAPVEELPFYLLDVSGNRDRKAVATRAQELGLDLPVLMDETRLVGRSLGLRTAGEALLIRTSDWRILYRGAISGPQGEAWLKDAIVRTLAGTQPERDQTEATGPAISYPQPQSGLTYTQDIQPIVERRCVTCHTEGDIAPWAMNGYPQFKNYAAMIREVVMARRMPPWHADSHIGKFVNDHGLTPEEMTTLIDWLDIGAPRGTGEDRLARRPPVVPGENWRLGPPDLVIGMEKEEEIPAEGVFDYRHHFIQVKMDGDKWLRAVEVMPGNRAVLHHALIFLAYPPHLKHLEPEYAGGIAGYFAGYGPGYEILEFPAGTAKFLPNGSILEFQMHYTATGKPEKDRTRLGLYFYDGEPEKQYDTRGASNLAIQIPPKVEDHEETSVYYVSDPIELWGVAPHMHYRGSRFRYDVVYPDGRSETLLNVPFYDFNWQREYRFTEAKLLPRGTKILCTAGYNNSVTNPLNPDPEKRVRWGNQSWDEMLIGHFTYATANKVDVNAPPPKYGTRFGEPITAENIIGSEWQWTSYRLYFVSPEKVVVNGTLESDWFIKDGTLHVDMRDRQVPIKIEGDQLSLIGRKLTLLSR
jgi:hypothetical protein